MSLSDRESQQPLSSPEGDRRRRGHDPRGAEAWREGDDGDVPPLPQPQRQGGAAGADTVQVLPTHQGGTHRQRSLEMERITKDNYVDLLGSPIHS